MPFSTISSILLASFVSSSCFSSDGFSHPYSLPLFDFLVFDKFFFIRICLNTILNISCFSQIPSKYFLIVMSLPKSKFMAISVYVVKKYNPKNTSDTQRIIAIERDYENTKIFIRKAKIDIFSYCRYVEYSFLDFLYTVLTT